MITDDERREVVARLREWLAIPWYERPWSRDAMQSLGKMVGAVPGENIVERIADLIDSPTCEMNECSIDNGSRSWGMRCSRCGTEFEHEKPDYGWRYCPKCGAMVVEKKVDE